MYEVEGLKGRAMLVRAVWSVVNQTVHSTAQHVRSIQLGVAQLSHKSAGNASATVLTTAERLIYEIIAQVKDALMQARH